MIVNKGKVFSYFWVVSVLACNSVYADFVDICGASVKVDQVSEVDDTSQKLVLAGKASIVAKANIAESVLNYYNSSKSAASSVGTDKWKTVFEGCLKLGKSKLAVLSFLLYVKNAASSANAEFIEAVFLSDGTDPLLAKELASNPEFASLPAAIKSIVFLSLGISDIHWLRANLLGKSFYLNEEFKVYSENKLTESLKVKNVKLARKIASMLESLYLANAEKYKKYNLACGLIEDLLSNEHEPTSSQLLTLVSIRNTDTELRTVLDPFLIEGFHTLAAGNIQKGKYEEALGQISSINTDQATPTTHEIIQKIVANIDPASKILQNDTVNDLLINSAKNNKQFLPELERFYFNRTVALLGEYDFYHALRTKDYLKAVSQDQKLVDKLKVEVAVKLLQAGQTAEAKNILNGVSVSFGNKIRLFLDGYYGMPLFYILIILIPLLIKVIYEFFTKATVISAPQPEDREQDEVFHRPESHAEEAEVSQFVSNNRVGKQKNALMEEYRDCLSIFGLQKGADLKTIKTAYRNAVRKIHPDLNANNQSADDASRFVELTKTYDRLREIHRLLGLDSK